MALLVIVYMSKGYKILDLIQEYRALTLFLKHLTGDLNEKLILDSDRRGGTSHLCESMTSA